MNNEFSVQNVRVQDLYQKGKSLLKAIPQAALEARLLLYKCGEITENEFYAKPSLLLHPQQVQNYLQLVAKRLSGYPLAYILETQEFWSLSFRVGPGVLIPRPETEFIIEKVLEAASEQEDPLLIVDLGTGCGNIAVVLAKELPQAQITATDISRSALKLARLNARQHDVDRISFRHGSLFSPIKTIEFKNACHFLVSNPPYVSQADWESLPPEIREHEPPQALVAGKTGLEIIQKLVTGAGEFLRSEGYLIFEIGYDQKNAVLELFGPEWQKIECFDDLSGIPRVIRAQIK